MALSSSIVWEVRSASSDNNGGGYKTGASGIDYSQQASPQYALTGVTTAGADAILLTASAASDMVGNIAHIVSGTNFTAGFYEITSVVVGVSLTLDATCTTAAGSSGVVNIGGALASIGVLGSATANQGAVAGNVIHVKGFNLSGTSIETIAASGTTTNPIRISGYKTTRGDGYLGRTDSNGPLITTNFAVFAYTSTGRLVISGNFVMLENIIVTSAPSNAAISFSGSDCLARAIKVTNSSTNASAAGVVVGTRGLLVNSDIDLTGASGGAQGVAASSASATIDSCRIKVVSTAPAVLCASSSVIYGNVIYASGGIGISMNNTAGCPFIRSNTITGCAGDGIDIVTGTTTLQRVIGNMITDNTGFGIDANNAAVAVNANYNRYRDNVAGNTNLGTNWIAATGTANVTTDTGGPETDYTNSGTADYSLITGSPAKGVGLLPYSDIGALQRQESAGASGSSHTFS